MIGSSLIKFQGFSTSHHIRAMVRSPLEDLEKHGNVDYLVGDLNTPKACAEFIDGLDVIIHLAGSSVPLRANRSLADDLSGDLVGTLNLLHAIRDTAGCPHFVFASSGGTVYGTSSNCKPWHEQDRCNPCNPYGIHKLTAEHYIRYMVQEKKITACILRLANAYGVSLPPERMQGFIGVALHQLQHNKPIPIIGNPKNTRDYVHIDDVCDIMMRAISPFEGFDIVNVASGTGTSIQEIIKILEELLNRNIITETFSNDSCHPSLLDWNVLDISHSLKRYGWKANVTLREGMKRMIQIAKL